MSTESKALALITQQGWFSRPSGLDNVALQTCPIHGCQDFKFFINVSGGEKDSLWDCKVCAEHGNLYSLREKLGLRTPGVMSIHDVATSGTVPAPLPDTNAMHRRLMEDEASGEVLDYLVAERGWSLATIQRLKLGVSTVQDKEGNKHPAYVIPYFDVAGNAVFFKKRSVPPAKKMFGSPAGRENPLYNEAVLKPDMEELLMVEGEADCISLLDKGYETVVGVPGAGMKKAAWIEKLDKFAPKTIYLLYDSDKVGQDAAREMATRIGIDRCKNIVLPLFEITEGKKGKDINEFFVAGHSLEALEVLKADSKAFDVQGVQGLVEVLEELKADLSEHGSDPKYKTCWPSLDKKVGGFEPGDLVGWMAAGKCGKTTAVLNLLDWTANAYDEAALMYCLEMSAKRMVRKWVAHKLQLDDSPGMSEITPDSVDSAIALGAQMRGDILFGYSRGNKPQDVYDVIRQSVRRYGVKHVCFDHLQLIVTDVAHEAQQTAKIMKEFKALAMELNIVLHLIVQPNRIGEGQIVGYRNALGSSSIDKLVDTMIILHRNQVLSGMKQSDFQDILETDATFEPQTLVKVELSRFSSGGATTLWMDGARSTLREMSSGDYVAPKPSQGGAIPVADSTILI